MVDRAARRQLALLLRRYASGRIDGHELERALPATECGDELVDSLTLSAEYILEEDYVGTGKLGSWWGGRGISRRDVARWVLFLMSEEEYRWPKDHLAGYGCGRFWLFAFALVWAGFTGWWWITEGLTFMAPVTALWAAIVLVGFSSWLIMMMYAVFIEPVIDAAWDKRHGADRKLWPFFNADQYARVAARHPFGASTSSDR